jgi:hypothetical protein
LGTAWAFVTADRFFSEIRAVTNLHSNSSQSSWWRGGWANSVMSAYALFSTATPNANVEPLDEPPLTRKAQGQRVRIPPATAAWQAA